MPISFSGAQDVCLGAPPQIHVGTTVQFWRATRRGQPEPLAAIVLDTGDRRGRGEYPAPADRRARLLVIDRNGDMTVEEALYRPKEHGGWSVLEHQTPLLRR